MSVQLVITPVIEMQCVQIIKEVSIVPVCLVSLVMDVFVVSL